MNKLTASLGVLVLLFAGSATAEAASATRIQKSFNNWRVDCAEVENKSRRCALQYSLVSKKNKQVVFSWSVIPKTKEATSPPQAIIRTPTGVALGDGISVVFAGSEPIKVQYQDLWGARLYRRDRLQRRMDQGVRLEAERHRKLQGGDRHADQA